MLGFGPLGTTPLGALPAVEEVERSIASANWTGIEARFKADPALADPILARLAEVDQLLSDAGLREDDVEKGRAQVEALRRLLEGPEPELKAAGRTLLAIVDSKWAKRAATVVGLGRVITDIFRALF